MPMRETTEMFPLEGRPLCSSVHKFTRTDCSTASASQCAGRAHKTAHYASCVGECVLYCHWRLLGLTSTPRSCLPSRCVARLCQQALTRLARTRRTQTEHMPRRRLPPSHKALAGQGCTTQRRHPPRITCTTRLMLMGDDRSRSWTTPNQGHSGACSSSDVDALINFWQDRDTNPTSPPYPICPPTGVAHPFLLPHLLLRPSSSNPPHGASPFSLLGLCTPPLRPSTPTPEKHDKKTGFLFPLLPFPPPRCPPPPPPPLARQR